MTECAIYFDDLTPDAQERIKDSFEVNPEHEHWDLLPLIVLRSKEPEKNKE